MEHWYKRPGRPAKYNIDDLAVGQERFFAGDRDSIKACMWSQAKLRGWKVSVKGSDEGCEVRRTA